MIESKFLRTALNMCLRPDYYSGRGATTSDLNDERLERAYQALKTNVNEEAAQAFAQMVADIPVLSATDFILNLARFEGAGFKWDKSMLGNEKGVYVTDRVTALATIGHAFGGPRRDDTLSIRLQFLRRHGIKDPLAKTQSWYGSY